MDFNSMFSTPSLQFGNSTNSANVAAPSFDAFNQTQGTAFTGLNQGNSLGTQAFTGLNQTSQDSAGGVTNLFSSGTQAQPEVAGGFGLADGLNFGLGAAQALIGMQYQDAALDQSQQALDLNQTKYTDLRSDKAALNAANQERAATAAKKISSYS